MTQPRKGQAPDFLSRDEFAKRFRQPFYDPAFEAEKEALDRIEKIAWDAYKGERKSPRTEKAGPEFKDPKYDLPVEWTQTRRRLKAAEATQRSAASPSRVLVICGSARNDDSCPGEISKTWRLSKLALEVLEAEKIEVDLLDLSLLTNEYGRASTRARPASPPRSRLCHWPCSLLSQPRARPGRRLDERHLPALGRGARGDHPDAGELVPRVQPR